MAATLPKSMRVCPTRIDAAQVLVAHKVTTRQCQDRQRGRYHKCATCAYNNAIVAQQGLPGADVPEVEAKQTTAVR
jgi:hypothetical protein